jgi:glucosamine 6-phosphate synthetase-like amidotransferase/phosphosugar isomerase protein
MCGIVGYVGETNALYVLIPALQRLEYRGYDSARIAVIKDGKIKVAKKKRKNLSTYILPFRNRFSNLCKYRNRTYKMGNARGTIG